MNKKKVGKKGRLLVSEEFTWKSESLLLFQIAGMFL